MAALGAPLLHHQDPAFRRLHAQTVDLLGTAFGTQHPPVILPGEAVAGLEAAAASLIRGDDVVLNLVSGPYGAAFGALARRYAAEVVEVRVPYDATVPAEEVRAALARRPEVAIVSVVHCDTPTGLVNDLDAIAAVVAEHGALLIVDAVATFAGMPCDVAGWHADLVVAAPQKCLGGPPGLSLLQVSDAACRHMDGNAVRAGVGAAGLRLWAASPARYADTVTALNVPAGVDVAQLRAVARAESGVMFAGGQPELGGQVMQIAHMGPGAYPLSPVIALVALGRALRRLGAGADIGGAVEAAVAATWGREAEHQ